MYCKNCGAKISDNSKFCTACGRAALTAGPSDAGHKEIISKVRPGKDHDSKVSVLAVFGIIMTILTGLFSIYMFITMKTEFAGWAVAIAVLVISAFLHRAFSARGAKTLLIIFAATVIIICISFLLTTDLDKNDNGIDTGSEEQISDNTSEEAGTMNDPSDTAANGASSAVSSGTLKDDLGNIINGQYFYDDGENSYYSSYDENGFPHIYKADGSGSAVPIFDGFGWSLVVYDDWLYFSGNSGTYIDATYNLFRMRTDGSGLEHLNEGFCYNMSFCNEWLYYIKRSDYASSSFSFCRCRLDGSGEEAVISDGGNCGIVFENKIYFMDSNRYVLCAEPDGTSEKIIIDEQIGYFIIGNGSIIYLDQNAGLMKADIDGSNRELIKGTGDGLTPYTFNSYKDKIFYTVLDQTYLADRAAYRYYLYSINFDGTGNSQLYEGVSYGCYINVVNDKVLVLDYAMDTELGVMTAVARDMELDGGGAVDLSR
jgi:hypothetical protein